MDDELQKDDKRDAAAASTGNYCERCGATLRGELAVESSISGDMGIISIKEVSERNWILCDGCNSLLCHSCCLHPSTGLCDSCLNRAEKDGGFAPARMLLVTSVPPAAAAGDAQEGEEN